MKLRVAPGELPARVKLELFCRGLRLSPGVLRRGEFRDVARTRGGLGSGLDLVLPDHLWVNAPVVEPFARRSPLELAAGERDGEYWILRDGRPVVQVAPAPRPRFYDRTTSTGVPMKQVGVLQGGYVAFFPGAACRFWDWGVNCRFCSTGLNLGATERAHKTVEEVVEVALAAFDEGLASFVHLNVGFVPAPDRGVKALLPYVEALKRETDAMVLLQCNPPETNEWADEAYAAGADSMSSNLEFYHPQYFRRYCPGKAKHVTRERFFEWLEYLPDVFPAGGAAGEIIVGVEPVECSVAAVRRIAAAGAHPVVCAFRPLVGTPMEDHPPPKLEDLERVMLAAHDACRKRGVKMNAVDRVSIVMLAHEARLLRPDHRDSTRERVANAFARTKLGKKLFKKLVLDRRRARYLRERARVAPRPA
ncbi:MAG: hypothetical protein Kow0069_29250 [Promethearchaeota archaeon]